MIRPYQKLAAASLLLALCACASQPQSSAPTPGYRLPAPPPAGEPTDFVGMTSTQLRASFGAPSFSRRENGSELWRYDRGDCRTFFFLYPAGRDMAVNHVETIPHGPTAADPTCLSALRAKPASPTS